MLHFAARSHVRSRRMEVDTVTLDPIYVTEHDTSVIRFTFGGDTGFGRRFLDPFADEFFPKEEIFCSPDAIINCTDPLPGSRTLFSWIKPYFAHSDYQVGLRDSTVYHAFPSTQYSSFLMMVRLSTWRAL